MNCRISVVVPTIGRATLALSQEGLARQIRPPDEIIVVHDDERRGPGWARNRGIERSSGDIIAFLDDDAVPPPGWLSTMLQTIEETGVDGAGGSYEETDPLLKEIRASRPLPVTTVVDAFGLAGNSGNLLLKRPVLEECLRRDGYCFIESWGVYGSEDWELMMRIHAYGFRLAYVPVHVKHLRTVTVRGYMVHQFNRGVGIWLLHDQIRKRRTTPPQQSILWDPGRPAILRWVHAAGAKLIGPTNASAFSRMRFFVIHWLAEKAQGMGFLWGRIHHGR